MRRACLTIALVCATLAAPARQPDGSLGLIRWPNNGRPAIVTPGTTFEAELTQQAELRLVDSDGQVGPALAVEWTQRPGGRMRGLCTVPADTQPGAFSLQAGAEGVSDAMGRTVYVREGFPAQYVVGHLTDAHVGSDRHPRPAADILRDAIKAMNEAAPDFVLITGDLTENGNMEQFQAFLEALDTSAAPTFVCAGNHDRQSTHYERFFGPQVYHFRFGEDGYLAFDTKDYITADEMGSQDAELQIRRRAIKPVRWAIGFTHRYEPGMGVRSQLVLFADDPLDYLIYGHTHQANTENEKAVPWGKTRITITPATVDGYMRLFDIAPVGISPRPPERVAPIE